SCQAARKYWYMEDRVKKVATYKSTYDSNTCQFKIISPMPPFSSGKYNNIVIATICRIVFTLPMELTATLERLPSSAIHSRKADTKISREIITKAGIVIQMVLWPCTKSINATATINLSATGSIKAPKRLVNF